MNQQKTFYLKSGETMTLKTQEELNFGSETGYKILEWNTKEDFTGDSYKPGETITVTQDTQLYGKFERFVRLRKFKGSDKSRLEQQWDIPVSEFPSSRELCAFTWKGSLNVTPNPPFSYKISQYDFFELLDYSGWFTSITENSLRNTWIMNLVADGVSVIYKYSLDCGNLTDPLVFPNVTYSYGTMGSCSSPKLVFPMLTDGQFTFYKGGVIKAPNLKTAGIQCFDGCANLEEIHVNKLKSAGTEAFTRSPNLKRIYMHEVQSIPGIAEKHGQYNEDTFDPDIYNISVFVPENLYADWTDPEKNGNWNDYLTCDPPNCVIVPFTGFPQCSITTNLTGCSSTNKSTQVDYRGEYKTTVSVDVQGHVLGHIGCTMGGQNVTVNDGVIDIRDVTGDIVIEAHAVNPMMTVSYDTQNTTNTFNKTQVLSGDQIWATFSPDEGYAITDCYYEMGQQKHGMTLQLNATQQYEKFTTGRITAFGDIGFVARTIPRGGENTVITLVDGTTKEYTVAQTGYVLDITKDDTGELKEPFSQDMTKEQIARVVTGSGINMLGPCAFSGCTNLSGLYAPFVRKICYGILHNASSLVELSCPLVANFLVGDMGTNGLVGCGNLRRIYLNQTLFPGYTSKYLIPRALKVVVHDAGKTCSILVKDEESRNEYCRMFGDQTICSGDDRKISSYIEIG